MSLPLWERGLKFLYIKIRAHPAPVAPFVGAWIEIMNEGKDEDGGLTVAPFVGAWIEIYWLALAIK